MHEAIWNWKDDSKVKAHILKKQIKLEFNPPAASHMGGIWDRQIRTDRKMLNIILKEQTVDDKCLSILFCKVESIINGRHCFCCFDHNQIVSQCRVDVVCSAEGCGVKFSNQYSWLAQIWYRVYRVTHKRSHLVTRRLQLGYQSGQD